MIKKVYVNVESVSNGYILTVREDDASSDTLVTEGDIENLMDFLGGIFSDVISDNGKFKELSFLMNMESEESETPEGKKSDLPFKKNAQK
jgi:hypothetical protein